MANKGSIPACAGEPSVPAGCGWMAEVYPRVCGGTASSPSSSSCKPGLSPRVRGNPKVTAFVTAGRRSIPACAGEPGPLHPPLHSWGVYPRVCGGTSSLDSRTRYPNGLSPRVRGNLPLVPNIFMPPRSIPACAGEPLIGRSGCRARKVYPRVCGGTVEDSYTRVFGGGLSPRVRGNRARESWTDGHLGSIPACAGEPSKGRLIVLTQRVYPRVCGGTTPWSRMRRTSSGLSPRVRGNHDFVRGVSASDGSIPACAGEPHREPWSCQSQPVYPRVCGGTRCNSVMLTVPRGLSPRVRGNLYGIADPDALLRSIPACAGEPTSCLSTCPRTWVYPRVCGGTHRIRAASDTRRGLSPRVRGNRERRTARYQ